MSDIESNQSKQLTFLANEISETEISIDESGKKTNIPYGWSSCIIKDICNLANGRAFKPGEWSNAGIPIIRIQNLNNFDAPFNYCNFKVEDKYYVKNGDLLFCWSGTPGSSFGAHIWNRGKAVLNQHIFKVVVDENVVNTYFFMYLLNWKVREFVIKSHGTAGLAHITKRKLESTTIDIPPLNEQKRIVAKIEELFSKLDAGVESLKKAKAQLKRYRQSVLKAAFEGKLTEKWREKHKECKAFITKRVTFPEKQRKINQEYDFSELIKIPVSWTWITIGDIKESMKNGIYKPKKFYSDDGIPCLRMYNIEDGKIVWKNIKRMILNDQELKDYGLLAGDILINRVNSRELVGKSAVVPDGLGHCVYESKNIRLRVKKELSLSKYVNYWLLLEARYFFNRNAQQTVGMASINQEQISLMPIPLTSLEEQQKIVEEIERRFSIIDSLEKTIDNSLKEAERLRQAILKKAFEGRLVPQDPNDEPAWKLLERMKEEKKRLEANKKNRKKRTKKG